MMRLTRAPAPVPAAENKRARPGGGISGRAQPIRRRSPISKCHVGVTEADGKGHDAIPRRSIDAGVIPGTATPPRRCDGKQTSMEATMQPRLRRVLFNILCKDMATSVAFYKDLANFTQTYASDWYVVLTAPDVPGLELGLIDQVSEFTPRHAWGMHEGSYLTLVVDDVFAAVERARALDVEVIEEPVALDYGQTRALIRDPNGLVIDLSTPTIELMARDDIVAVELERTTAIDQAQPEDRGQPTGL
ncbi:MAG: hypothetical protein EOP19_10420 [Hyphomicrobiales bacterium]|nr:MAG: hypothetical protein EOP19_10420 [Hyphomicrobiales bacterium]